MRSRTLLSTIILFATLLGACDHTPADNMLPGPGYTTNIVWPLKVGNRWVGRVTELDAHGAFLSEHLDTIAIVGEVVREGLTWYADQRGVLRRNDGAGNLLQMVPADAGHHTARHTRHGGSSAITTAPGIAVAALDAGGYTSSPRVRSALRSYTEVTASAAQPQSAARCLYAPGLGPVLRESRRSGNGPAVTERWELIEASLR